MNRALLLLTLCQGFFLTNNVTFIAINGLVGLALAPWAWLATLPVTGLRRRRRPVRRRGRAATSAPGAGRARSSSVSCVAIAITALCAWSALNALLGRGGRRDAGRLLQRQCRPLSFRCHRAGRAGVQGAGDLLGARRRHHRRRRGPEPGAPDEQSSCRPSSPVPTPHWPLVALASLATISCIRFPPLPCRGRRAGPTLAEIAAQPVFIVAVVACALGYGVMNLLMAATPIAMAMCSHPFENTALVLEWHVLGMFVPSFFTGSLIRRFGALRVMAAGVVLNVICIGVALSGVELMRS